MPILALLTQQVTDGGNWFSFLPENADVAQLVEQLICNQLVGGSSPLVGFLSIADPAGTPGQVVPA